MKQQLYVYDCLSGKLRVSEGDFMAIGAGKHNTFRIRTRAESAGTFAQRNSKCRFFPHNKVKDYSLNGNRTEEIAEITANQLHLFVLCGGCFVAWYGEEETRPDFSNFDTTRWYAYHPQKNEWSDAIEFSELLSHLNRYESCVLVTFEGLSHQAFRIADLQEVADYLRADNKKGTIVLETQKVNGMICPFCQHIFTENSACAIASHPLLQGDSILGQNAMKRFTPIHYSADGQVLDEYGEICSEYACPECHHKLPLFFGKTIPHRIAVVGAPEVGKSYFLASLVHRLERELPRDFGIPFRDADPEQNEALNNMRVRVFYSDTPEEFREGRAFLNGQMHTDVWRHHNYETRPRPFIYTLNRDSASHSLIFYGCNVSQEQAAKTDADILKHINAVFFLFDPTRDASFREILSKVSPDALGAASSRSVCRQHLILADTETKLRQTLNLPLGIKTDIPVAIILTKCDMWQELLGAEPLLPAVRNGHLKSHNIKQNSARLRELLFRITPEICSHAEALSERVCYFASSAFGIRPEIFTDELTDESFTAPAGGKLIPQHVTTPALWLLSQRDNTLFAEA